jgi:hypothetical protein
MSADGRNASAPETLQIYTAPKDSPATPKSTYGPFVGYHDGHTQHLVMGGQRRPHAIGIRLPSTGRTLHIGTPRGTAHSARPFCDMAHVAQFLRRRRIAAQIVADKRAARSPGISTRELVD